MAMQEQPAPVLWRDEDLSMDSGASKRMIRNFSMIQEFIGKAMQATCPNKPMAAHPAAGWIK
jgi:hypothetical protein